MLLQVLKESNYRHLGIDGTSSTPCAQVVIISSSESNIIATWSYNFKKSHIIIESQTLGNQELIGRAPHRAQK